MPLSRQHALRCSIATPHFSSVHLSARKRALLSAQVETAQTAVADEKNAVPEHVIRRMQALELEVQQAYEAGFRAGYTAGAKVQVNVDLDLSSRRLGRRTGATTTATTSSSINSSSDDSSSNDSSNVQASTSSGNSSNNSSGISSSSTSSTSTTTSSSERDSIGRSFAKGLIWRLFSTAATVSIALLVLHDVIQVEDALKIGGLEFGAKFVLYFLHERLWAAITWL